MLMNAREKVAKGTLYGVGYLVVEGGGVILLTKLLTLKFNLEIAGFFTLLTYFLALSNILITSLGAAVTRVIASEDAGTYRSSLNIASGKRVAKLYFILLLSIYTLSILFYYLNGSFSGYIVLVYTMYCIGHLLRLGGLYKCFEILGKGVVGIDRLHQLIFSFTYGVIGVVVLYCDGSIFYLGCVYLLVGMATYFLPKYFERKLTLVSEPVCAVVIDDLFSVRKISIKVAKDSGALMFNNINGFMIMNGDIFVVHYLFGPGPLAEYSLYSRLAALIVAVGGLVPLMYLPLLANAKSKNQIEQCKKYRLDGIKAGMGFFLVSGVVSILLYPRILEWTFTEARQIPEWFIYLTLIYAALSIHIVVNGMPVIATGLHFFVRLSFFNAVMVVLFSLLGGYYFGLVGVPIGAIFASIIPAFLYRKKSIEIFS